MVARIQGISRIENEDKQGVIEFEGNEYRVYQLPENAMEGDEICFKLRWNKRQTGTYAVFTGMAGGGEKTLKDIISEHETICWYPSCGSDFNPVLFFNETGYERFNISVDNNQKFPDLFICTEILPSDSMYPFPIDNERIISKLNNEGDWTTIRELHRGGGPHGTIQVNEMQKLAKLSLETDTSVLQPIILENYSTDNIGLCYCFDVTANIHGYQRKKVTIVYVIAENRAFAKDFLLKNGISVDYIAVVRYGNSMGGGSEISPAWIRSILGNLNCKYYICNEYYESEAPKEDMVIFKDYPIVRTQLNFVAQIDGGYWSDFGDVRWHKVLKEENRSGFHSK